MMTARRSFTHSPSITGRTTSSATSIIFEHVEAGADARGGRPRRRSTSSGVLPAPAPKARVEPSICTAPARTARTLLATDSPRFSWPWKPTCASSPTSATSAATRSADLLQDHGAGRVDHVDALAAGVGHDPGLGRQRLGRLAVGHHQEARPSPARAPGPGRSAGSAMSASVQCVAIRTIDTPRSAQALMSSLVPRPGQHQRRDPGPGGGSPPRPSSAPARRSARSRSCTTSRRGRRRG